MNLFILAAALPSPFRGIVCSNATAPSQFKSPCKNVIREVKYSNSKCSFKKPKAEVAVVLRVDASRLNNMVPVTGTRTTKGEMQARASNRRLKGTTTYQW